MGAQFTYCMYTIVYVFSFSPCHICVWCFSCLSQHFLSFFGIFGFRFACASLHSVFFCRCCYPSQHTLSTLTLSQLSPFHQNNVELCPATKHGGVYKVFAIFKFMQISYMNSGSLRLKIESILMSFFSSLFHETTRRDVHVWLVVYLAPL